MHPSNPTPFRQAGRPLCALAMMMALLAGFCAQAEDAIPRPLPGDRYDPMGLRSPFALATPVTPQAAPEASFAANWYITGLGRIGDKDYVSVKSRDLSTEFSIFGRDPVNGVTLASVNWSDTMGKSTVVLRKGTETAKLEFNEAELRAPPPASPAPNAGTAPNPASGAGQPLVSARSTLPLPDPRAPNARGVVVPPGPRVISPGGPNTVLPPQAGAPGAGPNIRRRPMPIGPPR